MSARRTRPARTDGHPDMRQLFRTSEELDCMLTVLQRDNGIRGISQFCFRCGGWHVLALGAWLVMDLRVDTEMRARGLMEPVKQLDEAESAENVRLFGAPSLPGADAAMRLLASRYAPDGSPLP